MPNELPQGPVKIIVSGVIGVGLLVVFYNLLSLKWFLFSLFLLAVEIWTFFNKYAHDTISEVMEALSARPLVPLVFGAAIGWALTSNFIPRTTEGLWIVLILGTLLGHFFWQFKRNGDRNNVA